MCGLDNPAQDIACRAKPAAELLAEPVEQLHELDLFLSEMQQGSEFLRRGFVNAPLHMSDHEGHDVFFHKAEQVQIAMRADVVDGQLFFLRQEVQHAGIDPHFRQERSTEIERLLAADDVVNLPIDLERLSIGRAIVIGMMDFHGRFPHW